MKVDSRLYKLDKLERIFSQQVDLKSALDSKNFLQNSFFIKIFIYISLLIEKKSKIHTTILTKLYTF